MGRIAGRGVVAVVDGGAKRRLDPSSDALLGVLRHRLQDPGQPVPVQRDLVPVAVSADDLIEAVEVGGKLADDVLHGDLTPVQGHKPAGEDAPAPYGQVRTDEPERADVDGGPETPVIAVLELHTRTDRVVQVDRPGEVWELVEGSHARAVPVHVDSARDVAELELVDCGLDGLGEPAVLDQRVLVGNNGQRLAVVLADHGPAARHTVYTVAFAVEQGSGRDRKIGRVAVLVGFVETGAQAYGLSRHRDPPSGGVKELSLPYHTGGDLQGWGSCRGRERGGFGSPLTTGYVLKTSVHIAALLISTRL